MNPGTPKFGISGNRSRAWYGASINTFLESSKEEVLGVLANQSEFTILPTQRDAWKDQINLLQEVLQEFDGMLFLEFNIPRMGRRVDAVLILVGVVVVVEFKVGDSTFTQAALDQVWDYALDLKNFHKESHLLPIVPVLVATEAHVGNQTFIAPYGEDRVFEPIRTNKTGLREVLERILCATHGPTIDGQAWVEGTYQPTPTILEAARALYAQHSVEAITRSDAGARNLKVTSKRIGELMELARNEQRKIICFVTGVPGAGKTLVGLNVATQGSIKDDPATHAVFLSGNGPLVAVLREALTRDELQRRKLMGGRVTKVEVGTPIKAFIQNVHHFRDDALRHTGPPPEHVVIFDEAQRAWNLQQTATFMQKKKGQTGFSQSEPEFLISYLNRHPDWAVVICLVGGGQEIHTGEAGIGAWVEAVATRFNDWEMFISPNLSDSEYTAGTILESLGSTTRIRYEQDLHLAVSMRSFRAEHLSSFVKAMLDLNQEHARALYHQFKSTYPLALTRSLDVAKRWLKSKARGTERYGLVASSKALRLKAKAIDIRVQVDPVHWFLNGRHDPRSSDFLEDAATEFQDQGLELDWACVSWDADFRLRSKGWSHHDFRGDRWVNIHSKDNQHYLKNAYRVLLTRARQGMVIFIPEGEASDQTRCPDFYDGTFNYLKGIGLPVLGA